MVPILVAKLPRVKERHKALRQFWMYRRARFGMEKRHVQL